MSHARDFSLTTIIPQINNSSPKRNSRRAQREDNKPLSRRKFPRIRKMRSRISGLLAFFLLLAASWAQVSTSRIEGTITDKTGAVVPDASVKIANEDTGISYEAKTSSSGTYTIPSLRPGVYSVTVAHEGFGTFTSQHNVLSVGQPLVVNATLEVGGATQVVQVESSYQRIETANAAISDIVTE